MSKVLDIDGSEYGLRLESMEARVIGAVRDIRRRDGRRRPHPPADREERAVSELPADVVGEVLDADPLDIAWAAGLFEGEGCIRHAREKNGTQRRLTLVSTDLDVIEKFAAITGGGIRERSVTGNRQRAWVWQIDRWALVSKVLRSFYPHLCARRGAKALELLRDPAAKQGDVCPRGHALRGPAADVYRRRDGRVSCRPCHLSLQRARLRTRKACT